MRALQELTGRRPEPMLAGLRAEVDPTNQIGVSDGSVG
jgi:hypothetical protein